MDDQKKTPHPGFAHEHDRLHRDFAERRLETERGDRAALSQALRRVLTVADHKRIEKLRGLLAASTPAPWTCDDTQPGDVVIWGPKDPMDEEGNFIGNVASQRDADIADQRDEASVAFGVDVGNGRFIAAAREEIEWLLSLVDDEPQSKALRPPPSEALRIALVNPTEENERNLKAAIREPRFMQFSIPIPTRQALHILDREPLFASIRELLAGVESGEIETGGVIFIMPFTRVREMPVMASDEFGNKELTTRTLGMAVEVGLSKCGVDVDPNDNPEAPKQREALHELLTQAIRDTQGRVDRYLGGQPSMGDFDKSDWARIRDALNEHVQHIERLMGGSVREEYVATVASWKATLDRVDAHRRKL